MLERVGQLQSAVKIAREEANSIQVDKSKLSAPLLQFIFE
jgi:hypothetical protein